MSTIIGIDPGPTKSSIAIIGGQSAPRCSTNNNSDLALWLSRTFVYDDAILAIEFPQSFGMPVGASIFETCMWAGRFVQAWPNESRVCYRKSIVTALCGSARAKDANVRAALIEHYGGKSAAIGNKKTPGPLYGIHGDEWQALAVALYVSGNLSK